MPEIIKKIEPDALRLPKAENALINDSFPILPTLADQFSKIKYALERYPSVSTSLSNNGKLDIHNCIFKFFKGIASPVTSLFSSPGNLIINGALAIGVTALLPKVIMGLCVIAAVASICELISTIKSAYQNKNLDKVEHAFESLGENITNIGLLFVVKHPSSIQNVLLQKVACGFFPSLISSNKVMNCIISYLEDNSFFANFKGQQKQKEIIDRLIKLGDQSNTQDIDLNKKLLEDLVNCSLNKNQCNPEQGDELKLASVLIKVLRNYQSNYPEISVEKLNELKLPLLHSLQALSKNGYAKEACDPKVCFKILEFIKSKKDAVEEKVLIDKDTKVFVLLGGDKFMPDQSFSENLADKFKIPAENITTVIPTISFFETNEKRIDSLFAEIKKNILSSDPSFKRITVIIALHGDQGNMYLGPEAISISRHLVEINEIIQLMSEQGKDIDLNFISAASCYSYDRFSEIISNLQQSSEIKRPTLVSSSIKGNISFSELSKNKLLILDDIVNIQKPNYTFADLFESQKKNVLQKLDKDLGEIDKEKSLQSNYYTVFDNTPMSLSLFLNFIGIKPKKNEQTKITLELSSLAQDQQLALV